MHEAPVELQSLPLRPQQPEAHDVLKLAILENTLPLATFFFKTDIEMHPETSLIEGVGRRVYPVQVKLLESVNEEQPVSPRRVTLTPVILDIDGDS